MTSSSHMTKVSNLRFSWNDLSRGMNRSCDNIIQLKALFGTPQLVTWKNSRILVWAEMTSVGVWGGHETKLSNKRLCLDDLSKLHCKTVQSQASLKWLHVMWLVPASIEVIPAKLGIGQFCHVTFWGHPNAGYNWDRPVVSCDLFIWGHVSSW